MLLMLFTSYSFTAQTKEDYLLKSSHQKTTALILLSGGTALVLAGGLIGLHGVVDFIDEEHSKNAGVGPTFVLIGAAAIIGSIPFFIASSKNRRRSRFVSFTSQPLPELVKNIVRNKFVPSISLHFKL